GPCLLVQRSPRHQDPAVNVEHVTREAPMQRRRLVVDGGFLRRAEFASVVVDEHDEFLADDCSFRHPVFVPYRRANDALNQTSSRSSCTAPTRLSTRTAFFGNRA